MKALQDTKTRPLEWHQPDAVMREHELSAGADKVATLNWDNMFGTSAHAETAAGSWTLKRSGFLSPLVTVRVKGSEIELARFRPGWTGQGTLEVADGARRYRWNKVSFWSSEWIVSDDVGRPLIRFKPRFSVLRRSADVEVEAAAEAKADLTLLLVLGWYLMGLMADDGADGGGAAAAAG